MVLALAAATGLALLLAVVIGRVNPTLAIWIAPASVLRTGLEACWSAPSSPSGGCCVDPAASFRRPR